MKAILLAACLLGATTAAASAHAMLEKANPGAGAVVPDAKVVMLQFSEELEPAFSDIAVSDAAGRDVAAAKAQAGGETMRVMLKPLSPGTYRVHWHAVSVDTHRTEGAYVFTVKP